MNPTPHVALFEVPVTDFAVLHGMHADFGNANKARVHEGFAESG
jgi:hypothetical protein